MLINFVLQTISVVVEDSIHLYIIYIIGLGQVQIYRRVDGAVS